MNIFSDIPSAKFQETDDFSLLALAAAGDTLAEEALVIRYTPMVYSYTKNCYRDGWERSDFVQEGMVGLLKAIREFDPARDRAFPVFAAACIKNELYGALRRALGAKNRALSGYISLSGGNAIGELLADDGAELEGLLNREEARTLLAALEKRLSSLEKKVLSAWLGGFGTGETALALGIPQKSVDNALTRIRRKASALFLQT